MIKETVSQNILFELNNYTISDMEYWGAGIKFQICQWLCVLSVWQSTAAIFTYIQDVSKKSTTDFSLFIFF